MTPSIPAHPPAQRPLYRFAEPLLFAVLVAVLWYGANSMPSAPGSGVNRWANSLCALGELALGLRAWQRDGSRSATFILGALAGLQYFAAVLGLQRVDPQAIGWLLNGDWAQHYAGWATFRSDGWHWPLGAMPDLLYPVGSSIVYTDSLPLLALPLKLIAPLLPASFQYIGFWLGVNFVLQGAFGALLLRTRSASPTAVLAAAVLFVAAPVLIARINHDSLTTHWLLLAALWLYLDLPSHAPPLRAAAAWWALAAVAALVHPYFVVMLAALHLAYWAKRVWIERAASLRFALVALTLHAALTLLLWYLSGALSVPAQYAGAIESYGHYNFNLVGFVDAMGLSPWTPNIPLAGEGQYEGFSYLGLGVLALLVLLLVMRLLRRGDAPLWRRHWPLLLALLPLTLLAIGSRLSFGPWTVFGAETHWPPLAAFRASGRFIWPLYYAVFAFAVRGNARRFGALAGAAILGAASLLQLAELRGYLLGLVAQQYAVAPILPGATLTDPHWPALAAGKRHLTLAPSKFCGHEAGPYLPFQLFAATQHLTFNGGYYARWDIDAESQVCRALYAALKAGQFSADDVYVVGADWREFFQDPARVRCEHVETYTVCRTVDSPAPPSP